jgi:type IV secretion system protein VirB2
MLINTTAETQSDPPHCGTQIQTVRRKPLTKTLRRYLTAAAVLAAPVAAHAQVTGGTNPATILNNIATYVLGTLGQSISACGIILCAILLIFSAISFHGFIRVLAGIAILFGAAFIVTQLTGGG